MLIEYNREGFSEFPIRQLAKKAYQILEKENHPLSHHIWGNNTTILPSKYLTSLDSTENLHYQHWYPISFVPHLPIIDKPFAYYNIYRKQQNDNPKKVDLNFELFFNLHNEQGRAVRLLSINGFEQKFAELEETAFKNIYQFKAVDFGKKLTRKIGVFSYKEITTDEVEQLIETMKSFYTDIYNLLIISLQESAKEFIRM